MKQMKREIVWAVWAAVIFIAATYSLFFFMDHETIVELCWEDGLFENLTALFFLISALILFFKMFRERKADIFLVLLALFFLFVCGEEISWGQRIFNYETPSFLMKANVQQETNLHNFEIFNRTDAQGHDKPTAERLWSFDFLFSLFWLSFCFLVPVADKFCPGPLKPAGLPVVPLALGAVFPAYYLMTKIFEHALLADWSLYRAHAEIKEFVFSWLFVLVSLLLFSKKDGTGSPA